MTRLPLLRRRSFRIFLLVVLAAALAAAARLAARGRAPRVDASLLRALLAQYPAAVSVSPDAGRALFKTRHERDFELVVRDLPSQRTVATLRSDDTQVALAWRPDGRAIAFLSGTSGDRRYRLGVWDLASGRLATTRSEVTRTALPPLRWSPRGDRIAWFAGDASGGTLVSLEIPFGARSEPAVVGRSFAEADFQWSPDGRTLAYVSADQKGSLALAAPASGRPQRRIAVGPGAVIRDLAWSPDGNSLLATVRGPRDEFDRLVLIDVRRGSSRPMIRRSCDISRPVWLPDGRGFAFEANEDGMRRIVLADAARREQRVMSPPRLSCRILGAPPAGGRIHGLCARLDGPPLLGFVSARAPGFTPLADSPAGAAAGIAPRPLTLASRGARLPAIVWRPRARPPGPARGLLYVHGGPGIQETPVWDAGIQALLRRGFTAVVVNYGGSTGYGRSFEDRNDLETQGRDVLAAQDYLTEKLGIAPRDIVLVGSSAGTRVAAQAAALRPDGFGSLVLLSTLSLPPQACPEGRSLRRLVAFHGRFDGVQEAPRAFAALKRCFGEDLFTSARGRWRVFSDEGHQFQRTRSWAEIYSAIAEAPHGR